MQPMVEAVGALEPKMQVLTDAELKDQTRKFRERLAQGEALDDLLVEAFGRNLAFRGDGIHSSGRTRAIGFPQGGNEFVLFQLAKMTIDHSRRRLSLDKAELLDVLNQFISVGRFTVQHHEQGGLNVALSLSPSGS